MKEIETLETVFVQPSPSKYIVIAKVSAKQVFAHPMVVFPFEEVFVFSILMSNIHEAWVRQYSSTLETRLRYTPSDCFETFPFPKNTDTLEAIGETYYTHRQTIMRTRQKGLTKTYNHFHDPTCTDPDIQTLRHLHIQMDTAVAAAYGWQDLALDHDFHNTKQGLRFTISETARRQVLDRLLALNHQRYAEEVAQGLHDRKKANAKGKPRAAKGKKTPVKKPASASATPSGQGSFGGDIAIQGELF